MKIIFMNGGLGNQLFQYIFLRWLEIVSEEEYIIDDSAFCGQGVPHNGYEIERLFGIKKKKLSECFSGKVWESMLLEKKEKSIPQQLLGSGMALSLIYESGNVKFNGNTIYVNAESMFSLKTQGNWYFHGYWLNDIFFKAIETIIKKELVFPVIVDQKNRLYEAKILNTESVAIHIRRGDMVQLGWCMKEEYFQQAIEYIEDKVTNAHYFIFSDDLAWCKDRSETLGLKPVFDRVTFIDGNKGFDAYKDLQLMTLCKHRVLSRSSFSFLASILSENKDKDHILIQPIQEVK